MPAISPTEHLRSLLPLPFRYSLTAAERQLIAQLVSGDVANCTTGDAAADDPAKADAWGPERTIRAEVLAFLCTDQRAADATHWRGIQVRGARITGRLNLAAANLARRLVLTACDFPDGIDLDDAHLPALDLSESLIEAINARNLTVAHDVLLRRVIVRGGTMLIGANIGGRLDCSGGRFEPPTGTPAITATNLVVKGAVLLRSWTDGTRFHATGEVSLYGADIGGSLDCSGGRFEPQKGTGAITADNLVVKGDVFLRSWTDGTRFHATGEVRLVGADIGGTLDCSDGRFEPPAGTSAITADNLVAKGDVVLRSWTDGTRFHATGEVSLIGANIGGDLDCSGGRFEPPAGTRAITAESMMVKGGVFLRSWTDDTRFHATGEVRLMGANIGGSLDCSGGRFEPPAGTRAITAERMVVKGAVVLRSWTDGTGFHATGEVRLMGADIGLDLDCDGAELEPTSSYDSIIARGVVVGGNVRLGYEGWAFSSSRRIWLAGANIGGDLDCSGAQLQAQGDWAEAFDIEGAVVKGALTLPTGRTPAGVVSLRHATVGRLVDSPGGWPEAGKLDIEGFHYDSFSPAITASQRIDWLSRQRRSGSSAPQQSFVVAWARVRTPGPIRRLGSALTSAVGGGRSRGAQEWVPSWGELEPNRGPLVPAFVPGNYDQAAAAFQRMGRESDAIEILIAKQRALIASHSLSWESEQWHRLLGKTIGHGYRSELAVVWLFLVWAIGCLVFWAALGANAVAGQSEDDRPTFFVLFYSLDALLPLVDLHQETYWQMTPTDLVGTIAYVYLRLHILFGWALSTLFVVGMSGLVRQWNKPPGSG